MPTENILTPANNAEFITPVQRLLLYYAISLLQQQNSKNLHYMFSVFTLQNFYSCLQAM